MLEVGHGDQNRVTICSGKTGAGVSLYGMNPDCACSWDTNAQNVGRLSGSASQHAMTVAASSAEHAPTGSVSRNPAFTWIATSIAPIDSYGSAPSANTSQSTTPKLKTSEAAEYRLVK